MFDKKTPAPNELESGEINLLPETMRSDAAKYQRSSKEEAAYQLRAPKKEKKRRSFFAWLPFFGGTHWQATTPQAPKAPSSISKVSGVVRSDTSQRPGQGQGTTSSPVSTATPPSIGPIQVAPLPSESKHSFKAGLPLSSLFAGKKSQRAEEGNSEGEKYSSDFTTPPRHYSLLSDAPAKASLSQKPVTSSPISVAPLDDSMDHSLSAVSTPTAPRPSTAQPVPQKRRWPKWLDIFALIGAFTRRTPKVQKVPQPILPIPSAPNIPKPAFMAQPSAPAPITPSSSAQSVPDHTPSIPIVSSPTFGSPSKPVVSPMQTSVPQIPQSPRQKKSWHIFDWFLNLFRSRTPRIPKAPMPMSSAPSMMLPKTPAAPSAIEAIPSPAPVVPVSSLTPVQAPASPVTPAARPLGAPPMPPAPAAATTVTPRVESATPAPGKKQSHQHGFFHMPAKSNFAAVSKELRDINLIPGATVGGRSWREVLQLVGITVIATSGIIGLIYGGLHIMRGQLEKRTVAIDAEINTFKKDILVYNAQEPAMSKIGAKVELVAGLLHQHIYWTNFFNLLEKYTLADIYYDGVSATTNGNLTLSAHGTSFETVSQELQLLNSEEAKEFVSAASITGAQLTTATDGTEQVSFSVQLTLNPKLFYYNAR